MRRTPSLALAIVGLMLILGSGRSWAGQPPCATSDADSNTACGTGALENNGGLYNTAIGDSALYTNTTGIGNAASGAQALYYNTSGSDNTANGYAALGDNTTGIDNTAAGYHALLDTTTGNGNTAFGANAGAKNVTGRNNTFIGFDARPNRGNYANGTAIGYGAVLTASDSIVLGDTGITKIYAEVSSITAISDRRRKKDIAPLGPDLGLAFIAKLRPVSYRYNNGDETQRYGFIAQDLEQALPVTLHDTVEKSRPEHGLALIERQNDQARTYRVAYGELTAPMVAAIQQQQAEIAELKAENAELRRAQATADDAMLRAQKKQAAENAALRQSLEALRQQVGAMKLARNSSATN